MGADVYARTIRPAGMSPKKVPVIAASGAVIPAGLSMGGTVLLQGLRPKKTREDYFKFHSHRCLILWCQFREVNERMPSDHLQGQA